MNLEDFLEFVNYNEEIEEEHNVIRVPKRYIRDQYNPFEFFGNTQFKKRYRFSKHVVMDEILPLVINRLEKNSNRGLPIHPMIQLFTALRFYATGNFQVVTGDLRGISQASVSLIIKKVSIALAEHLGEYIHFPNNILEQQQNLREFHQIANFPNVAACVDGTHILIKNPGGDIGEIFRNRKGKFSLNVQVACNARMDIMDIVARHPGSTHDNVIFERSALSVRFENNEIAGLILGDNGYACKPYLLTPVLNPITRAEQNYNRAHISTRNIIERVFGVWKQRFPCLWRVLLTNIRTSVAIICATAVLYNIGRRANDNIDDEEDYVDQDWVDNVIIEQELPGNGLGYRTAFIITHF